MSMTIPANTLREGSTIEVHCRVVVMWSAPPPHGQDRKHTEVP